MKTNRREFIGAAACFSVAGLLGANVAKAQRLSAAQLTSLLAVAGSDPDGEVGKPYRGWREGELDLNFIHTGVGESCFQICPDGTTILTDAGDRNAAAYKDNVAILPNDSRRSGEWIARYVGRAKPGIEKIDYVVASHFHDDHVGSWRDGIGVAEGRGDYQISGITHVGEFYSFGAAFDRGYPEYDRPTAAAPRDRENLRKFFDYKEKTDGLKREAFVVGALDQIKLVNEPEKYDFHVRNICRNGVVWTGQGAETVDYYAKNPKNTSGAINENTCSLATVTSFGPFRFFSGGDVSCGMLDEKGEWVDYEGEVGRVAGPVDVCKSNHHSYRDAMAPGFVKATRPRVYVTCVWDRWHLQDNVSTAMTDETSYPGDRLICPTAIHPENAEMMEEKPWLKSLVERAGTVVVKVYDGGKKYKVYYLTAEDESMTVTAVYGPFDSRGGV